MKMVDSTSPSEMANHSTMRVGMLLALLGLLGACRPPAPVGGQGGLMRDTEILLASGEKWKITQSLGASLEECEAEGERHIKVVQELQYIDRRMREYEVARVYTTLRLLGRIRGLPEKEAEFQKKAVEALQRSGAPGATSTMVDALEKRL